MTPIRVLLLAVLCAACGESTAPEEVARVRCRAHYDILWRFITGHGTMPTTDDELRRAAQIEGPDPWGNPFLIETDEGEIRVCSSGPDGEAYTDDDICYPPVR